MLLSAISVIVIPLVAWLFNRESRRREDVRAARDDARAQYEELAEAFSIYDALSSEHVFRDLNNLGDPAARDRLVVVHNRSAVRFSHFESLVGIPDDLKRLVGNALSRINEVLPSETSETQESFNDRVGVKQNHAKDESVQARMTEFARALAAADAPRGIAVDPRPDLRERFSSVRLSRGGQGVELSSRGDDPSIWIAGSGKGELPHVITHTVTGTCSLRALKKPLAASSQSGTKLAEAFLAQLERMGEQTPVCACGARLSPANRR